MSKMRAMVVPEPGGRFRMEERDLPEPGRHEVRLRVHACGVCHSDSMLVEGLMPGLSYPRIPGHEVIGVIDALGPDVEGWAVGARVGVGWFGGSCGYCGHCRRGDTFACENIQGATGITRDGGYATHMLALASALAHVPEALDFSRVSRRSSAPALPPSTPFGTAARSLAIWWRSMASAGLGISAYNSPPGRDSGPWRSIGGATKKPWRDPWVRTTISTVKRGTWP